MRLKYLAAMTTCNYRSTYSKSDDRGADVHEHNRSHHPDHMHEYVMWGPDTDYWWSTDARCYVCGLTANEDRAGMCA